MPGLSINKYRSPQHEVQQDLRDHHEAGNTYRQLFRAKVRAERKEMCWFITAIISTGLLVYMAGWGTRVEPYVVHLDAQAVEHVVQPIPRLPIKPEQNIVRVILEQWTNNTRAISFDPVVFATNWTWVKDRTTSQAWQRVKEMQKEQEARRVLGTRVEVRLREVLPVGGTGGSWALTWEERAFTRELRPIAGESLLWKATVRVADFQEAAAKNQLNLMRAANNFRNILGIFIADVAFAQPAPLE